MIFDTYIGESELPVKVTYSFTEGRKAFTYGLPENCYPAEASDAEVEEVNVFGVDILDILSPAIKELIEEQALEHAVNAAIDYDEQKADYERSQREEC